jgi:hypothetical protein
MSLAEKDALTGFPVRWKRASAYIRHCPAAGREELFFAPAVLFLLLLCLCLWSRVCGVSGS